MANHFKVRNAQDVVEAVTWALSENTTLEIRGLGSKRGFGRPMDSENILDLSELSGVSLYEPDELVLSAGIGTPIEEIEKLLHDQNQCLAFEPPNYTALLNGDKGQSGGTLGGIVATNLAGPRRLSAGAARDHLLGFTAVNGRGEIFKSGGRVVKNVTGYDLCKVMAGSHGTLAALTTVTVKVLPVGRKSRTVLVYGLSSLDAAAAHALAGKGAFNVSAMSHLPAAAASRSMVDFVAKSGRTVTALRLEGTARSVEHRTATLRDILASFGETEELHSHRCAAFWRQVSNVAELLPPEMQVWKISLRPSDGPALAASVISEIGGEAIFDWACGLVWLALPKAADAHHEIVRRQIADSGHATLLRAEANVRAEVPVFQPQQPAVAGLSARLKHSFDPQGVFNPGRMYRGV